MTVPLKNMAFFCTCKKIAVLFFTQKKRQSSNTIQMAKIRTKNGRFIPYTSSQFGKIYGTLYLKGKQGPNRNTVFSAVPLIGLFKQR